MMLLWSFAGVPLGVYTIAQDLNIALQIQPQLLTFLSLVTWGQCLYYKKVRSIKTRNGDNAVSDCVIGMVSCQSIDRSDEHGRLSCRSRSSPDLCAQGTPSFFHQASYL